MEFLTIWFALGLALLAMCGVQETITYLALDLNGRGEDSGAKASQAYLAFCLTLLVLAWPVVLLEMVRSNHR